MAAVRAIRQHLIDPELCARCNSCEETCPKGAISHDYVNYAVDPALCGACLECIDACSTGAIDSWRHVLPDAMYTVAEQLTWETLPAELHAPDTFEAVHTGNEIAPAGAAVPVINQYTRHAPASALVLENRRITAADTDIHHIVLDFGALDFPVLEGQCLSVIPPGHDTHGHAYHVRVYSVASARDGERVGTNTVALTVKRVTGAGDAPGGVCSSYLCDLPAGAQVRITGPSGASFLLPGDPQAALLMICAGTGIAPMRGMIQRRMRSGAHGPMTLFYGARTPQEMAYHDELAALPPHALRFYGAFSRACDRPRQYVQHLLRSRVDEVARLILDCAGYVYICGLTAMRDDVESALGAAVDARGGSWAQLLPELRRAGRYHVEVY